MKIFKLFFFIFVFTSASAYAEETQKLSPLQERFLRDIFIPVSGEEAKKFIEPLGENTLFVGSPQSPFFIRLEGPGEYFEEELFFPESMIENAEEGQHFLRRYIISDPYLHPLLKSHIDVLMPYQRDALEAMKTHFNESDLGLVILPTATGKTVLAAHYGAYHFEKQRRGKRPRILFIVDNLEVLDQSAKVFEKVWDIKGLKPLHIGMYTGREKFLDEKDIGQIDIVFASFQTLINPDHRRNLGLDNFSLVIIDEFHKGGAAEYNKVVEEIKEQKETKVLGLTATAFRSTDDVDVPAILNHKVIYNAYTVERALKEGWVVPFVPMPIVDDVSREGLIHAMEMMGVMKWTLGFEEDPNDKYKLFVEEWLKGVIEKYQEKAWDSKKKRYKKGLIYIHNQAAAFLLESMFERAHIAGIHAKAIVSDLPPGEEEHRTQAFREGKINVAITCNMFKEGIDIPDIEVIAHLKRGKSIVSYAHEVGRGMRLSPGKTEVLLLEFMFDYETMVHFVEFCRGEIFQGEGKRMPEPKELETYLTVLLGREIHFDEKTIEVFNRQKGELISARTLQENIMKEWAKLWEEAKKEEDKEKRKERLKKLGSCYAASKVLQVGENTLSAYVNDSELRNFLPLDLIEILLKLKEKRAKDEEIHPVEIMKKWAKLWNEGGEEEKKGVSSLTKASKKIRVASSTLWLYLKDNNLKKLLPQDLIQELMKQKEIRAKKMELEKNPENLMERWAKLWDEAKTQEEKEKLTSYRKAAKSLGVSLTTIYIYMQNENLQKYLPADLLKILLENQRRYGGKASDVTDTEQKAIEILEKKAISTEDIARAMESQKIGPDVMSKKVNDKIEKGRITGKDLDVKDKKDSDKDVRRPLP